MPVRGPYLANRSLGRYRVSWQLPDGRWKSKTSTSREDLVVYRARLEAEEAARPLSSVAAPATPPRPVRPRRPRRARPSPAGDLVLGDLKTAANWAAADERIAQEMSRVVAAGEVERIDWTRKLAAVVGEMEASWTRVRHIEETEAHNEVLITFIENLYAGRVSLDDDATKPQLRARAAATLTGRAGPGAESN